MLSRTRFGSIAELLTIFITMSKDTKSTSNTSDILSDVTSTVSQDKELATTTIQVVAPYKLVEPKLDKAFKSLAKNIKADGFRPGKAPKSVIEKQVPEIMVVDQAARDLIADLYLPLLQKHEIDGIGEPKLQITKLAINNPLEFSITLANAPSVAIADYKKIIKDSDDSAINPKVSDKELDDAIKALRQQWAQQDTYQKLVKEDPDKAKDTDPRQIKIEDKDLPQLSDDWVKQLGPYESIADFKAKFETNIKANKGLEELDKRRANRMGEIVAATEFSVPEILYQSELDRLVELRKAEIKQAGLKFGDYLKALGQNEDQFREGMTESAKNRVQTQLVIAEIAKLENLSVDDKVLDAEVEHLKKTYPDADLNNIRAYVTSQLLTNEVLQFIANSKDLEEKANKKTLAKKSTKAKSNSKTASGSKASPKPKK